MSRVINKKAKSSFYQEKEDESEDPDEKSLLKILDEA